MTPTPGKGRLDDETEAVLDQARDIQRNLGEMLVRLAHSHDDPISYAFNMRGIGLALYFTGIDLVNHAHTIHPTSLGPIEKA